MARPLKPKTPFAERLIRARGAMGRNEAASRLKTHPVTLGSYERGVALPTVEVLIAMREVYGVSLDWLISGTGEMRLPLLEGTSSPMPATPPPLDRLRLRSLFQAFIDTVIRQPATLQQKPEELADWLLRGYEWLAGPSSQEDANIAGAP
ncbi:helix-turn-helix transcriptional regulator [Nitrospirillum sp. BR 11828]|uniref:helix-turn-helix domain-containing protein n=1 Tax=Nitrospirillum sp. BR 11828 TaxID=3104325 RepID=UPI002ACA8D5B|nr:helix-turn-helix transcriptional regulator [Nitrospirillum sp. BR 11828]MDZ5650651.1 helix-turn-helix transcriptional regulator [Nitrospirillum sp. BR 11828]